MTVNTLLLMLLVESMVIATGFSIVFYVKYKRLRKNPCKGGGASDEFKENLKKEFRALGSMLEEEKKSDKEEDDKKLSISSLSARRQFLSAVIKGLDNVAGGDETPALEVILRQHDEITAKLFKSISLAAKDRKLIKSLAGQCQVQSAQLEEYKNKVIETTEKINNISKANKELTDTLQMLIPEAEMSAELKEALSKVERSNNELDTCLSTLEEENLRLSEEAGKHQGEINDLSDLADNMANEYNSLLKQKKASDKKCKALEEEMGQKNKKLEKELEEKNKSLSALQNNYETLEAEYERLYEETKGDEAS